MKNLPPDIALSIQSNTLFSKTEERLLSSISSVSVFFLVFINPSWIPLYLECEHVDGIVQRLAAEAPRCVSSSSNCTHSFPTLVTYASISCFTRSKGAAVASGRIRYEFFRYGFFFQFFIFTVAYGFSFSDLEENFSESDVAPIDPLTERELVLAERHLTKQIRQLENELPKWHVLVECATGKLCYLARYFR